MPSLNLIKLWPYFPYILLYSRHIFFSSLKKFQPISLRFFLFQKLPQNWPFIPWWPGQNFSEIKSLANQSVWEWHFLTFWLEKKPWVLTDSFQKRMSQSFFAKCHIQSSLLIPNRSNAIDEDCEGLWNISSAYKTPLYYPCISALL